MIDLAETARRSPQPVQHWILSWREREQPSSAQADEAVAMFLEEVGLGAHQVIYALHRNTKNCHLHMAVSRVHPETEKLVTVNNGFDHEVAHRAVARIEQRHGWEREGRALFVVHQDGQPERSQPRGSHQHQPSSRARDFEERAGERSAQRIAFEIAAPIIRDARTWDDMHTALARERIRFERKRSGAILWIGEQPVKASSAGRECSMAALEKRLGEFTPAPRPDGRSAHRSPSSQLLIHGVDTPKSGSRHHRERRLQRERILEQQGEQWSAIAASEPTSCADHGKGRAKS